jgi:NADPH-dependent 2,4-dienoyl-CoA reductase/sulfur reductase-like enzyme
VERVVVVGASAAGLAAAESLRRNGFHGELTMVGAEAHHPYDRPPLSKQVLRGDWEPERVAFRKPEAVQALEATWLLGTPAAALDTDARTVRLADDRVLPYDGLVIATGLIPRPLPYAQELTGVHLFRTVDDALALRAGLTEASTVVVVGGGFLGTEIAAAATGFGCRVTLIDPLPAPLAGPLGKQVGELVAELHTSHGVRVRCGTGVRGLTHAGGRVTGVTLDRGENEPADLVLVAIGATPATGWLVESGVPVGDGVLCDAQCRAAPGVVAAGDVARWDHPRLGSMRVEHRMNATEHGAAAAAALLGADTPFAPVPFFWTDQYDVKIQVHGHPVPDAELHVVQGDPNAGPFAAVYEKDGRVRAALAWGMPKAGPRLRKLVIAQAPLQEALAFE